MMEQTLYIGNRPEVAYSVISNVSRGGNTTINLQVIFDQMFSNFSLTASFIAKLSILITPVT